MRWMNTFPVRFPAKIFPVGLLLIPVFALFLSGCDNRRVPESAEFRMAREVVFQWNDLLLELERQTPGYRAPVSARMFGYVGIAAYEAARPEFAGNLSLAAYFPEYRAPEGQAGIYSETFCLPAGLNTAYAEILRQFFPTAPPYLQERIQLLESENRDHLSSIADRQMIRRSEAYGKAVAWGVWQWSISDTVGHDGYLYNFDRNYAPPAGAGFWQPAGNHPMPALLPHWGNMRSFIAANRTIELRPPLPYSERPGSPFYTGAMEVYALSRPLSRENQWIAEFWSDDIPGLTISPAGRWMLIAGQCLHSDRLSVPEILETYLRLGVGLSDAMTLCWKAKYRYCLKRPETFIRSCIDPQWQPLHDSPPFPAYPSGHAILAATACKILSATLGESFRFVDRSHENSRAFQGTPRTFTSFGEMADEVAFSRLALGVHYRMDCEEGLRLGQIVGQQVIGLRLHAETRDGESDLSTRSNTPGF